MNGGLSSVGIPSLSGSDSVFLMDPDSQMQAVSLLTPEPLHTGSSVMSLAPES